MISPRTAGARAGAVGLLAGLAGSLCCLGPSAALLLGAGASSALWGLAIGRGLALTGGLALLGVGMALALRHACMCALGGWARWRAPLLMLAAFVLSYGLLGVLAPELAAQQAVAQPAAQEVPAVAVAAPAASTRRATLLIEKMNCPPCAAKVRSLLARKPFVRGALAEPNNEQVVIDYDPAATDVETLVRLFPHSFGITLLSDVALRA
jgi:hypothetical protein